MSEENMTFRTGLLDRVDGRILELQSRVKYQYHLRDLNYDYNEVHVVNSPFPPRYRQPPSVLRRSVKSQQYSDYTISYKRYICLRTLTKHYMLQREYEVLKQRLKSQSPVRKSPISYNYLISNDSPNYRQQYAEIKYYSIQNAKQKRQSVKEIETRAVLVRYQRALYRQMEAQDVKAQKAELKVLKMQQETETAMKTQKVKQSISYWAEYGRLKTQYREQQRIKYQELEMDELIENVMEKENEITYLQEQIRIMKEKMGQSVY